MSSSDETMSVRFSAKELFQQVGDSVKEVDRKLDTVLDRLESKADASDVVALAGRIAVLETDKAVQVSLHRATWAVVGLLLAIAGLLVPIVLSVL